MSSALKELQNNINNINKAKGQQSELSKLQDNIKAISNNAENTEAVAAQQGQTQGAGSRVWNTVKGAEKQYAGSSLDTLGSLIEFGATNLSQGGNGRESDAERLVTTLTPEERKAQSLRTAQNVRDTASDITASGQQDIEKAKEGLGETGQFLVDLGVAGTQLVTDIALGGGIKAASKGAVSAMLPFGTRAFGGATQQAAAEGADINQQIAYGTLDAAKEIAVEKISSVGKIFSRWTKGATDKVVDKAITKAVDKLAKTDAGKTALTVIAKAGTGAVGEALEEAVGGVIEPYLQKLTYNPDAELNIDDIVYDALIALPLGALGGGLGSIGSTNRTDSTQAQPATQEQQGAQPTAQETNMPAAQTEALNSAAVVRTNDTINAIFDSQVGQEYLKQNYGSRAALRQQIRQSNPALSDWQVEIQAAQIVRDGIANTQHETSAQSREAVKIARLAQLPTMEDAAAFQTQNKALQAAQGAENINTLTAAQNTAEGVQIASPRNINGAETMQSEQTAYNPPLNTNYADNFSNPQDRLRAYLREPVPEGVRGLTGQQAALYNNLNNTEGGMQNGRNALYDEGRNNGQDNRSAGGESAGIRGAAGEISQGRDTAGGNRQNESGSQENSRADRKRIKAAGKQVELSIVPYSAETAEQRKIRKDAQKRGVKNVVFFRGDGYSVTDNKYFNGLYDPQSDTLYVQIDSTEKTVQQILEHEMYHFFAAKNPKFVQRTLQTVKRENKAAYVELYKEYEQAYGDVYDDNENMIAEEMFADIFAGAQESELHDAVMQNLPEGIKNIMGVKPAPAENGVAKSGGARFSAAQIIESNQNYDFSISQRDINSYVENAYSGKNTEDYKKYLKVDERLSKDVKDEIPDIGSFSHAIRDNDIRHVRNSHGENSNEKYPVTANDQKTIPFIVQNYDKAIVKKKNGVPGIVYVKVMDDNIVYYLEAVARNYNQENLLINKQMIKTGINDIPNLVGLKDAIQKRQSLDDFLADLQEIRKAYVQDASQTETVFGIKIPHDSTNVNRNILTPAQDSEGRELSAQQKTPRMSLTKPAADGAVTEAVDALPEPVIREQNKKIAEVTAATQLQKQSVKEKAVDVVGSLRRVFEDSGLSVAKFGKAIGDTVLYPLYNNTKQARQQAEYMLQEGQYNLAGQKVGESLMQIFDPIRKKGDDYYIDFQLYLLHIHNINRMAQNKPIFGENVTAGESRAKVQELEKKYPEFVEYAQKVWNYTDNLMQYRVDSGLIAAADADKMVEMYPHYVPTFRDVADIGIVFDDEGTARIAQTVKRADGSSENILPIHESLARQTMQTVQAAKRNIFGLRLMNDALQNPDVAQRYVQRVVTAEEMKAEDEANGVIPKYNYEYDIDEMKAERNAVTQGLENAFFIYDKGKSVKLRVTPEMFTAVDALITKKQKFAKLTKLPTGFNNLFKKLITAYNPMFIITNAVKDIQDVGLYSQDLKGFAKHYGAAWKGMKNNSALWQTYQAMGGFGTAVFNYEQGYNAEQNKQNIIAKKIQAANFAVEQSPRFTEFMAVLAKENARLGLPEQSTQNYEALVKAMYAAQDVTVNFGRSGVWGKTINATLIPFFNPSIQGFSKMIRTFTSAKNARQWTVLVIRAAALGMLPSIINAAIYDDDDEYEWIDDYVKDNNYLFKIKDGLWVKVPKGRVVGMFGSAAQRMMRTFAGDDDAWADFFTNNWNNVGITTDFIWQGLFDTIEGKTWYGTNIESQRLQKYAPGERFDEKTDAFSKAIGKVLNISPKRINYFLDQYAGVVGDFGLPLLTPAAEQNPFVKKFTVDPVLSNKIGDMFYDRMDRYTEMSNSYSKTDREKSAAKLASRFLNKQQNAVSSLNAEIREIENSNLPDKEKLQQVREIKAVINELEKNALQSIDAYYKEAQGMLALHPDSKELDRVEREVDRKLFGAEYALREYNKDIYAKAAKSGLSFNDYYNGYFAVKDLEKTSTKTLKEVRVSALQKMGWNQKKVERFLGIQYGYTFK